MQEQPFTAAFKRHHRRRSMDRPSHYAKSGDGPSNYTLMQKAAYKVYNTAWNVIQSRMLHYCISNIRINYIISTFSALFFNFVIDTGINSDTSAYYDQFYQFIRF